MDLPFSHEAFLDVFGAYNRSLWPAVVLIWLATAWLFAAWLRRGRVSGRVLFTMLAIHWAWSGIAYHWLFFREINPAAMLFGALFVLQAALFAWLAFTSRGRAGLSHNLRTAIGVGLVAYGLIYPLVGSAFGLTYPRMPLFAVPCPTTLVTAGWLITAVGIPRVTTIIPVIWAIVGGSAAFTLGVRADLVLILAAVVVALDALAPTALGERGHLAAEPYAR